MNRYITIHGHFYQPPRENPWLETIQVQDSAYPYHDWNERIDAECYAPNSSSRILDPEGRIASIANNYARISYNFGPTLLAWAQEKSPETYRLVLDADTDSQKRFGGHGSALAQCYNHMIMPLANRRDKYTQVRWGLRDFEHRFGRFPEGMWLPETAVDVETLEILAEHGIRFTILAQHQAKAVRQPRRAWREVSGAIDPTMVYSTTLPSRRKLALFFYDGPISRAVAFERLLDRGENLAGRLTGAFSDSRTWPQLVHIATDGETYGHHHRHGEMALAYALQCIEEQGLAKLTNYGEYLSCHPPTHEVQIQPDTSWSCVHGIERWRSNCGCNSGRVGWNQEWRAPLRGALDWLRDTVAPFYEQAGRELLKDPWAARDDYIEVILDRSADSRKSFFERHGTGPIEGEREVRALKLLELQRHSMLMYTSCGWFFDELSGIETVQVIQYAGRVVQLTRELGGPDLEAGFLERLEQARSNIPEHANGRVIYDKFVRPAMVDLQKVAAHYAISTIFDGGGGSGRIYSYSVESRDAKVLSAGKARLALGRASIISEVTQESADLAFGVAYLGDHNVSGGIREFRGDEPYRTTFDQVSDVFRRGDFAELIRMVDREFGPASYSLATLFRDEQWRILRQILESTLGDTDEAYRGIYQNHVSLMRFLASLGYPLPKRLELAAEVTLNSSLRRAFESDEIDVNEVTSLVEEARVSGVPFDAPTLEFALRKTLERLAGRWEEDPERLESLERLDGGVGVARSLPFEVVLWRVQNIFYNLMKSRLPEFQRRAGAGEEEARELVERIRGLGEKLKVRVE